MAKRLEPCQILSSAPPHLVVPPLREPVYRAADHEAPDINADHKSLRGEQYFWKWLDDLKAVRYL